MKLLILEQAELAASNSSSGLVSVIVYPNCYIGTESMQQLLKKDNKVD